MTTGSNWLGGVAPPFGGTGAIDTRLYFDSGATSRLNVVQNSASDLRFRLLQFEGSSTSSPFTLTGGRLFAFGNIGSSAIVSTSNSAVTIANAILFTDNAPLTIQTRNAPLTLSGPLTFSGSSGTLSLIYGTGTRNPNAYTVLSGATNFLSAVTIGQQAEVRLGHGNGVPQGASLTVEGGGVYDIRTFSNTSATGLGNVTVRDATFRIGGVSVFRVGRSHAARDAQ